MAADKNKYTDRHETDAQSSTAVDDSLDEYGVWVKSGPEDVSDEETPDSETIFDLQQDDVPDSDDIESIPEESTSDSGVSENDLEASPSIGDYPESMELSEEEEALLADLEDSDSNIEAPDSSETAAPGEEEGPSKQDSEFSAPGDTESSYDSYDTEDSAGLELPSDLELSDDEVDTDESQNDDLTDLGFPDDDTFTMDLPDDEGAQLEIPRDDESFSMDDTGSDDASSETPGASVPADQAGEPDELENDLEISFEDETFEEDSQSDIHFEYSEDLEDLPDFEDDVEGDSASPGETEPPSRPAQAQGSQGSQGAGGAGDHEMGKETPSTGEEVTNPPVTEISLEEVTDETFDDVNAVAGEMSEPLAQGNEGADTAGGSDYSKHAFQLIQNELASIKSELAGLKEELHDLRGRGVASSTPASSELSDWQTAAPEVPYGDVQGTEGSFGAEATQAGAHESGLGEEEESMQAPDGGFFEEDEDETIALTGDELDNILNTAEFIEEQGQPTDFEDSELDLDLSSLEEEASQASVTDEEIEDNIVELDSSDEDFTFDLPDSGAEAIESSSADFSMEEDTGSLDQSAENQSSQDQLGGESEPFGASHEEVDALANMDIDSELADIDELDEAGSETAAVADLHESDESASATGAEREPEAYAEPESVLELEPEAEPAEAGHAAEDTPPAEAGQATEELPESLREEIRSVLGYMDQLLESLPEEKIREFANSEHFEVYKRLFEELELEP